MLIEFKIKNFLSIKDEVTLSMEESKHDNVLSNLNIIRKNDFNLKKSVVMFGPNGSGKTNILKGIFELGKIVLFKCKKDSETIFKNFLLDSNFKNNDVEFNIKVIINDNIYDYCIIINLEKLKDYHFTIKKEKLLKNSKLLYEINQNQIIKGEYKNLIEEKISDKNRNVSVISHLRDKNFDELDEIYNWFQNTLEINFESAHNRIFDIDIKEELKNNQKLKKQLINLLNQNSFKDISDLEVREIDNTKIIEKITNNEKIPKGIKDKHIKFILNRNFDEMMILRKTNSGKIINFNFENDESSGTKKFIELLVIFLKFKNEKQNKVVFFDELETSLHPALLKRFFEFIHKESDNIQIITTTHAYPLLLYVNDEDEIFRRDQIYFTRLIEDRSTELYSLVDIGGIRKDLKIFKAYFDGRISAFPLFDEEDE